MSIALDRPEVASARAPKPRFSMWGAGGESDGGTRTPVASAGSRLSDLLSSDSETFMRGQKQPHGE